METNHVRFVDASEMIDRIHAANYTLFARIRFKQDMIANFQEKLDLE